MSFLPPSFKVERYTHGFRVYGFGNQAHDAIRDYCRKYSVWDRVPVGRGKYVKKMIKTYATRSWRKDSYYFIIGMYDEFMKHMQASGIRTQLAKVDDLPVKEGADVMFDWPTSKQPYDYQIKIRDFLMQPFPRNMAVPLQTGKGKTTTSISYFHERKKRVVLILKPMFMMQWVEDLIKTLGLKKGEIVTINGLKAMRRIIEIFADGEDEGENIKVIVIANRTYQMYLDEFKAQPLEKFTDMGYKATPLNFFETVGAGVRLIDEVHMGFHLNAEIDAFTNVPKSVALSATLDTDDKLLKVIYGLMFPPEAMAPVPDHHRYIDVRIRKYRFHNPGRLNYLNGKGQYSQTEFEKSIMRDRQLLNSYVAMVVDQVKKVYMANRDEGQKVAIYFGLTDLVQRVVDVLEKTLPEVKVGRFIDVDPDEVLHDSDIIVTTLQSAGTAKDIPGLRWVMNFVGICKKETIQQLVGRLRELKGWDSITPEIYFYMDGENPKHRGYMEELPRKLSGRVQSINTETTQYVI